MHNPYALYGCKCCGRDFIGHPKRYRPHYSLKKARREKYLNRGEFLYGRFRDSAGCARRGRLLPERLDRNEVEFGWADLRCFIFAVFRMSYKLHAGVCGRKTQKQTLSPAYTYAQFVRLSAKQQRASQIRPPKLTNISVKAFLEAAAPVAHPAKSRKRPCKESPSVEFFL